MTFASIALLPALALLTGCSDKGGEDTAGTIGETGISATDTDTLPGDDGTTTDDTGGSPPVDGDGDGYTDDEDCDDDDASSFPGADEVCDGLDNDCDGEIDNSAVDAPTWYQDADDDGYGLNTSATTACDQPDGYSAQADDCDDTDPAYNPGALEEDCTDPNDYNCDGSTGYADDDGDGYAACEECDDTDAEVHPDATEICDDIDNNCDGDIDGDAADAVIWYADTDADTFGDPKNTLAACDAPKGYTDDDGDCDDTVSTINPDALEFCNDLDDDCNGLIDDAAVDADTWFADDDGDGFGTVDDAVLDCEQPLGYLEDSTDCDDTQSSINPDADEVCNGLDDNCDGLTDNDAIDAAVWYLDGDGDEYGVDSPFTNEESCAPLAGYSDLDGDCDDADMAYNPGAAEDDCADPNDYNCDGSVAFEDLDADGYAACEECDDSDAAINPDAVEVCDGADNDCDGTVDIGAVDVSTWYQDNDLDGYGDPDDTLEACDRPDNYLADNTDCDDADGDTNPGAVETCDDEDDDCDLTIDEDASDAVTVFADDDGDGFGDVDASLTTCDVPGGYVFDATDCDDTQSTVNPDGTEVCNDTDDDCDVSIDEEATDFSTYYADLDEDSYGDPESILEACETPDGYTTDNTDCNDTQNSIFPGADEICNELDDDCDVSIDESPVDGTTFYADADTDGFGDAASTLNTCEPTFGYVENDEDCNDADTNINPDADEVCNELDDDCDVSIDEDPLDGVTYYADADGDTFGDDDDTVVACEQPSDYSEGGGDCDDSDGAINPDATEVCNETDDDCDVSIDEEATDFGTYYADLDEDGYGDPSSTAEACDAPDGFTTDNTDCDDGSSSVYPGAEELCNDDDDDCDVAIDEDAVDGTTFYIDTDGDGFGDVSVPLVSCDLPAGYSDDGTDCDDEQEWVYPGAPELCDDQFNDCDTAGTWVSDDGVVTLFRADGSTPIDYTADFTAGSSTSAPEVIVSTSGDLEICDGYYYTRIRATAAELTINGSSPANVTIDGAYSGQGPMLFNATNGTMVVAGITLTAGYGCHGAANAMYTSSCGAGYIGWSSYENQKITIVDSVIADNDSPYGYPWYGGGVATRSSEVTVIDTAIHGNATNGLWGHNADITCEGSSAIAAGVWDNTFYGMQAYDWAYGPSTFTGVDCDFDQGAPNGYGDLYIYTSGVSCNTYVDDETFFCDETGCDYCP